MTTRLIESEKYWGNIKKSHTLAMRDLGRDTWVGCYEQAHTIAPYGFPGTAEQNKMLDDLVQFAGLMGQSNCKHV
jgi:hypothetical protein